MQYKSCLREKVFRVTLLSILLLFFFTSFAQAANIEKMPKFSLENALNGKTVNSEVFKGKVLLITFFATWCPPCREEIPSLIKLQNELSAKGFSVLGFSVDEGGPKVVKKLIEQAKINYPILMTESKTVRDFGGITGVPTTFLINKTGKVVSRYLGYVSHSKLEKDIKAEL